MSNEISQSVSDDLRGYMNIKTTYDSLNGKIIELATHQSSYSSLQDALTAIGTQKKTLLISSEVLVTANTTIPSNVSLWFTPSGSFTISNGVTLTINGTITAGMWKIFNGSVNGSPKIPFAYAEWFGAVINDSTVDNAPIIQTALTFFHKVHLTKGTYYLNSTIVLPYGASLVGMGRLINTDTIIFQQANLPVFTFASGAGMVTLDNFVIQGNIANVNNDGILFNSYGSYSVIKNLLIYQCGGHGIHASGSASTGVDLCSFQDVKIDSCYGYGIKLELDPASGNGFNTSKFTVVECMRNQKGGFYIDQSTALTFERCHAFWNESITNAVTYGYTIASNQVSNLKMINCWSESSGEHLYPDPTHKSGGFVVNGGINLSFDNCHTTNEDRGFIINGGTNIIIDNPDIHVLTYATCCDILIQSSAVQVIVKNYNMPSGAVVANFSTSSWIETTVDYNNISDRVPMNSRFKRTQKGKAEVTAQGTTTQYQYNASINGANIGDTFLVWTTTNNLRIGDNILIPNAGASGAGLNAQITDIDYVNKKIILSTSIVTAITSSSVPATVYPVTHSEIFANTHSATTVTGYWQIGDIIWYINPNVYYATGEVCVFAGTGGSGGSAVWIIFGYASGQTGSSSAPVTGGTIATTNGAASYTSVRVSPTANITGVKLQAGSYAGHELAIYNESAFSITFDVSGNSKVADGTNSVIASNTAGKFSWDAGTSLWYRIK
jgi:hypothetical protein